MVVVAENPVDYNLSCWSKNSTNTTVTHIADWPLVNLLTKPCLWASRVAVCNVVTNPTEFAITDGYDIVDIRKVSRIAVRYF